MHRFQIEDKKIHSYRYLQAYSRRLCTGEDSYPSAGIRCIIPVIFYQWHIAENKAKPSECEPFSIHRARGVRLLDLHSRGIRKEARVPALSLIFDANPGSESNGSLGSAFSQFFRIRFVMLRVSRGSVALAALHCTPHKTTSKSIISTDSYCNYCNQELGSSIMVLNALCSVRSEFNTDFPCNINAITVVSLGIGAGACALIFVLYLLRQVRLA
jgi:hypothetical protein